jgi:uncharacterized membrane protein YphA (DoxX/SURF4 family)
MYTNYRDKSRLTPINEKTGNVLLQITLGLLGLVFIFSGFVKAIDPLGSTYKFDEYFRAFGGAFEMFTHISFPLAVLLSTLELVIGLSLIFKVQLRIVSIGALAFMLVMTPLTLYIALKKDLVTDCGCFGDALVISNWATFFKNLVFLTLAILLVVYRQQLRPLFTKKVQDIALTIFVIIALGLSAYCYRNLPLIDFLPYKVGVNIPAAMAVPDSAAVDKYETTFIYAKNGSQKEFTLENYPKGDSTWKFVDQKTKLITSGYKAPIHDFTIVNAQFEDITEQVLYDNGYTYLLIIYDLNDASENGAKKAEKLYQQSLKTGAKFYALTSSTDADIVGFKQKNQVTYPFCKTDATALKTIIRANPGLILLKKGTIVGKWNWRDFE